eukprot:TRINITY_DN3880_c0_g1_i1.p1 TRINITY_DN3880_c0_g1~~TRINITY_DN3880_c0_g1_i1.p1  ORF type:complete len:632 (+),score=195.70 TRINITY_DN3880_c0_g1_i1:101-1996(+)
MPRAGIKRDLPGRNPGTKRMKTPAPPPAGSGSESEPDIRLPRQRSMSRARSMHRARSASDSPEIADQQEHRWKVHDMVKFVPAAFGYSRGEALKRGVICSLDEEYRFASIQEYEWNEASKKQILQMEEIIVPITQLRPLSCTDDANQVRRQIRRARSVRLARERSERQLRRAAASAVRAQEGSDDSDTPRQVSPQESVQMEECGEDESEDEDESRCAPPPYFGDAKLFEDTREFLQGTWRVRFARNSQTEGKVSVHLSEAHFYKCTFPGIELQRGRALGELRSGHADSSPWHTYLGGAWVVGVQRDRVGAPDTVYWALENDDSNELYCIWVSAPQTYPRAERVPAPQGALAAPGKIHAGGADPALFRLPRRQLSDGGRLLTRGEQRMVAEAVSDPDAAEPRLCAGARLYSEWLLCGEARAREVASQRKAGADAQLQLGRQEAAQAIGAIKEYRLAQAQARIQAVEEQLANEEEQKQCIYMLLGAGQPLLSAPVRGTKCYSGLRVGGHDIYVGGSARYELDDGTHHTGQVKAIQRLPGGDCGSHRNDSVVLQRWTRSGHLFTLTGPCDVINPQFLRCAVRILPEGPRSIEDWEAHSGDPDWRTLGCAAGTGLALGRICALPKAPKCALPANY